MEPLPEDVLRFLDTAIQSVDQLEILRLLSENPSRAWSPWELAPKVQTDSQAVTHHLTALHARGLITAEKRDTGSVWRFGAQSPELQAELDRLMTIYRERPVSMIKAVYNRPAEVLRSFADAFRLRKQEE